MDVKIAKIKLAMNGTIRHGKLYFLAPEG